MTSLSDTQSQAATADLPRPRRAVWPRLAAALAVAGAAAFILSLGVRTLTSLDLGYHLAYGERFLDTATIVDSGVGVYSHDAYRQGRPWPHELPPGAWIDAAGEYRFPNANWLTQVVFAAVHRWGGAGGLCALRLALVAALGALTLLTMRNLGAPWALSAAALILLGLASYLRFLLRPELVGFVVLAGQLAVLSFSGKAGSERLALSKRAMVAMVALQVLMVNLHSYFLLGLGLMAAAFLDRMAAWAWAAIRGHGDRPRLARSAVRLAVVLAAGVAACLVNPWTWRLAIMPIQTLAFFRAHDLAGGDLNGHPWAVIGEFFRPFSQRVMLDTKATAAFYALLALAAAGGVAAAALRRWASVMMIAGMVAVALSMRRNIAPAAVVIIPLAATALWELLGWLGRLAPPSRRRERLARFGGAAVGLAVAVVGLALARAVAGQGFYVTERTPAAFGWGYDRGRLGLAAAEWINEHRPAGRIWCDYDSSSNLHYFVQPNPQLPVLTNTWAYPPEVMQHVLAVSRGQADETALAGVEVVVLHSSHSEPLMRHLSGRDEWAIVALDWRHVVFLRRDGANAALAARADLSPPRFDVAAAIARMQADERVPAQAMHALGGRLYILGWRDQAIAVLSASLEHCAEPMVMNLLGRCLAERARDHFAAGRRECIDDAGGALELFERAFQLEPSLRGVSANIHQARRDLARYHLARW